MMREHFDNLETRDPAQREAALLDQLASFLPKVIKCSSGWQSHLSGVAVTDVKDRQDLARLPVLRKTDLMEKQQQVPPFGGFTVGAVEDFGRIFMSPGPIFEPMGNSPDPWRSARALFAAGFRKGDVVHNAFAYHLTPGGFILDTGARALGCAVVPAGIGNTDAQVDAIVGIRPKGFIGTPDYLKVLLDRAAELDRSLTSIERGLVSGGALFPSLRTEYSQRGVWVLQCYATADVGVIAYESEAVDGMIVDEGVILEIVKPGTGEPVPDGDVGEVVITNFNPIYPMIRFATGDLSAILPGLSPCGRTNMRIKGWMGRADQTTKVKGMFVHPSQVAEIAKRHPELGRLRLEISRDGEQDAMRLKAESQVKDDGLADNVSKTLQDVCKLRGLVELVSPDSLPNDGKVIDDQRSYE